ncbi:MAG: TspO/MBR family protein [Acholeplasmataceae bacterium]
MKQMIKLGVTFSYGLMLFLNGLANTLPINGQTTGQISDRYENLFAPAGLTFSIWGLIYIFLGVYVYLVWKDEGESQNVGRQKLFILSSLLNGAWILSWHYDALLLSLLIMLGLLVTLIILVLSIDQKNTIIRVIFHTYVGWITVATIANVTIYLVSLQLSFLQSDDLWTVFILWVGVILGILTAYRLKSVTYLLVLSWAYIGIYIKHQVTFLNAYLNVLTAVSAALVIYAAMSVYLLYPKIKMMINTRQSSQE